MKNGMLREGEAMDHDWIWEEPCLVVRERRSARQRIARGTTALVRLRAHPTWQVLRTLLVGFLFGIAILGLLYFNL